jgi:hypothetical protein
VSIAHLRASSPIIGQARRAGGPIPKPLLVQVLVVSEPLVVALAAHCVGAAGQRDVSDDLFGVTDHRQPVPDRALLLPIIHRAPLSEGPTSNLCQFQMSP